MIAIPGYTITSELNNGGNIVLYRGFRNRDQCQVILKVLQLESSTPIDVATLHYEYKVTKQLNLPSVVTAYELEQFNSCLVLTFEDFGGEALEKLMASHTIDILAFLELAIQITEALSQVHSTNIFHKNINPKNIIVNPITQQVKLTNFSRASKLYQEKASLDGESLRDWVYFSPEQLGCDRRIDYRTDCYSLGVTFYKILTRFFPFNLNNLSKFINNTLAKEPLYPHQVNPDIPETLSHLIAKLLAKKPENRYQSARGLKADLEKCLKQWQEIGEIQPFTLGQNDSPETLKIPPKIYNREEEFSILAKSLKRVIQEGIPEITLISGTSGIGKTALVKEIDSAIIQSNGLFICGNFDSLHKNVPYSALIKAFKQLINQLLRLDSDTIEDWKTKLLEALGNNAQAIIEIIPELTLILGKQAPLPQLQSQESQNRFYQTFSQFISAFAQKEHPLVIFLDDLHDADLASLHLIQTLLPQVKNQYLLIFGAYQESEVDSLHPLKLMIEKIEADNIKLNSISLNPLTLTDVNQWIATFFKQRTEEVDFFANLIFNKTQGNPFFIDQILDFLWNQNILRRNQESGSWDWDLERLKATLLENNFLNLTTQKIESLSVKTQKVLQLAACLGKEFDLKRLSLVNGKSCGKTAIELWEALDKGLVIPVGENYRLLNNTNKKIIPLVNSEQFNVVYQFSHESIQQATYSLIPPETRQETYLKMGQILLQKMTSETLEPSLFEIVNLLNLGKAIITESERKYQVAEFNLKAGEKAKKFAAYSEALTYFSVGLSLLETTSWEIDYKLTLFLHLNCLECEYLIGNIDTAESLFKTILAKVSSEVEKINLYALVIDLYTTYHEEEKAVTLGIKALKEFGIDLENESVEIAIASAKSLIDSL
ncbi:MAG: ATP-binding protein, partial [Halothece sp.]